jgi:hypothetical protein
VTAPPEELIVRDLSTIVYPQEEARNKRDPPEPSGRLVRPQRAIAVAARGLGART